MKPTWILQHDIFREGNPPLMRDIIRAKGMECFYIGVTPFDPDGFSMDVPDGYGGMRNAMLCKSNLPPSEECVVAYGSIEMCERIAGGWTPTVWTKLENLRCKTYYEKWGKYILQEDHDIIRWEDLMSGLTTKNNYRSVFARWQPEDGDNYLFFRPDANLKLFTGQVVKQEDFWDFATKMKDYYCIPTDTLVVVAPPQNIEREWRFVVRKGKVVTGSLYKVRGEVTLGEKWGEAVEPKALALAEQIAADPWQPQKIYVLDICETGEHPRYSGNGGHYRLLEIGDLNAAGLYRCDLEKVVDAMSEQALEDWNERYEAHKD